MTSFHERKWLMKATLAGQPLEPDMIIIEPPWLELR